MDLTEIYLITNIITKKSYVGQAFTLEPSGRKYGAHRRWQRHLYCAYIKKPECIILEQSIMKHGPNNFIVEVIAEVPSDWANDYEILMIEEFDTMNPKWLQSYGRWWKW